MLKLTQKVRDHIAKAVLTPLSLSVLGFLALQGWNAGSIGLILYGVFLFLCIQTIAVLLLSFDDQGQKPKG